MGAPQDLSHVDLVAAADENLVTHASWVHEHTPGMRVLDAHDLVLVDSGLPCDTFNVVCRARLALDTAPERVRAAVDYFTEVSRPFSWWLTPGAQPPELDTLLRDAGLQRAETELAMAADLATLLHGDTSPNGLEIRRVRTIAQLGEFARIIAPQATSPEPDELRFYERAAPALLAADAPLWFYLGTLNGISVATAELTLGGGVAGLYSIVTLESYRRRGFGTAMTLQPLLDARAQGYTTSILQASDDGARVYERLGFVPFGQITEYKPPAPVPGVDR